eukprot:CAMPEP_0179480344 /NCGR_PEP_ID=MMETSP0799-20121207/58352_1 /TAXON_ID=46947 /ORGANISM="Geminigera cryophila, Strain CCMP2564" /LENGTH=62 /DNA_ID=CAMNT_0021292417 /DNA_START=107 /DNA_END=295 /DNA_ORIENTATION=+
MVLAAHLATPFAAGKRLATAEVKHWSCAIISSTRVCFAKLMLPKLCSELPRQLRAKETAKDQ